jgi:hypothetical protein
MTVISDKDRNAPLLETWADRLEQEMALSTLQGVAG